MEEGAMPNRTIINKNTKTARFFISPIKGDEVK